MSAPADSTPPLAGLRVLDLSTVVAGPFGSEVLGYLGAEVIRIDAPGSAGKGAEVKPAGTPVEDAEGFVWALQRNKRSICLDLKNPEGKAAFLDLVRCSDVVYDNFRPGVLARLGLAHPQLLEVNPRIIGCSISGFGSQGPWAEVAAYDAAVQALGGSMSITGTGVPGDIPCRLGVPIGDIGAALYAVSGILAALAEREHTGRGRALDIALLDVQLALNTYRVPQAFASGMEFGIPSPRRGGAGATPYGPFRCSDGAWIVLGIASNFWRPFCEALQRPEWTTDPRFETLALRQANQPELEALVEERLRQQPAQDWEQLLTGRGIPAARVNQIHEAFAHPQALARRMRVDFRQSSGRVVSAAASPIHLVGEAPYPQKAPVPIGTDTVQVLASLADWKAQRAASSRTARTPVLAPERQAIAALAARPGPLAGTLVLEFCGDEPSGTLGTQILADLGATVLKLERLPQGDPAPTPACEKGRVPASIAYAFGLNRNKRSMALDLKSEAGRGLALRLARLADVVYENHKPGTMARMGLGAADLRALNPRLVCCSVSGYGQDGPWSGQPAYDATVQAIGGVMSITGTGRPDAFPVRWGNPIGGIAGALYAVIGVLAALLRRQRSGEGAWLDIALFDAQLALHAYRVPTALTGRRYGADPFRGGSGALPYGPVRARDGRWFVLAITHQFWPAACDALGHPEWAQDPRFATEAVRQANEDELNRLVAEAIATRDAHDWQDAFVARGIPGAKVLTIAEAFEHPQVAVRGMLAAFPATHPVARHIKVAGDPIRFTDQPPCTEFRPVPGLGADSRAVLAGLLGLDQAEQSALRGARVVWWPDQGEVFERPSVV